MHHTFHMHDIHEKLLHIGLQHRVDAKGTVHIDTPAGPKLVKKIHSENLREQAFIVTRGIKGLCINNVSQVFSLDGNLYQLIDLDVDLKPMKDPLQCLDIVKLYIHNDSISMLTPVLRIDDLIKHNHTNRDINKGDGHPRAREVPIDNIIDFFYASTRELFPEDENRFRIGFFHEDLQTGNLMAGNGLLHVIDLDPIWHSYSVLNLAHFFVMEVIGNKSIEYFDSIRSRFLSVLEEETERDFDFFVLLSLFRALMRRAFHKDYFSESLESDFKWYFRDLAVNFYLHRVSRGE